MHVIESVEPERVPASSTSDARLWIGMDDRGVELVVALDLEDSVVIIHVMPTSLRR